MTEIKQDEHWSELYRKVLFEEDHEKLPCLLDRAQEAVKQRVLELWYSPAHGATEKERLQLHTAAYYLGLLRKIQLRKLLQGPRSKERPPSSGLWALET